MDKYKIEKNTVQETLVIPLYGRRLCSRMFPPLFQDESAAELMERIDYDFSELEKQSNSLMQVFGALEVAMRQSDLAWEGLPESPSKSGGHQSRMRTGQHRPGLRQRELQNLQH